MHFAFDEDVEDGSAGFDVVDLHNFEESADGGGVPAEGMLADIGSMLVRILDRIGSAGDASLYSARVSRLPVAIASTLALKLREGITLSSASARKQRSQPGNIFC